MGKYIITTPGRETVDTLLEKLADYVTDLEELQIDLSDYVEDCLSNLEDTLAQADQYIQGASQEYKLNRMLSRELNAARKEMLTMRKQMEDRGIQLPEGTYIHHRRLDPDLYEQDPDSPFYLPDPNEHFHSLLTGQLNELVRFEEYTPMTTTERQALRDHVIHETGFDPDPEIGWKRFLDGLRAGTGTALPEGR